MAYRRSHQESNRKAKSMKPGDILPDEKRYVIKYRPLYIARKYPLQLQGTFTYAEAQEICSKKNALTESAEAGDYWFVLAPESGEEQE
jgi:hypothetical protein